MKSCEFCDHNNDAFCDKRKIKLTEDLAPSCPSYKERMVILFTTQEYSTLVDSLISRITILNQMINDKSTNQKQKRWAVDERKKCKDLVAAILPYSMGYEWEDKN